MLPRHSLLALAVAALLSACAVGPDYVRPTLDVPAAWKESGDWKPADPRPAASGLAWWRAYGDPVLNGLMTDAQGANQNLRQAEAAYRQARALADADRAGLFPSLGLDANVARARTNATGVPKVGNAGGLGLAASWEPDLWGSVRRTIESGEAGAQASADDLAAARLSIQTTLAQDYLQLRIADQQRDLYAATVDAYAKALKLTQAQHSAGVALQSDVALAESQLAQAQAAAVDLEATRAQLEHAIAVLTGRAPRAVHAGAARRRASRSPCRRRPRPAGLPSAAAGASPRHRRRRASRRGRQRQHRRRQGRLLPAADAQRPPAASAPPRSAACSTRPAASGRWAPRWRRRCSTAACGARTPRRRRRPTTSPSRSTRRRCWAAFQQVEDDLALLRLLDQESALQDQAVRSSQQAERLALTQYRAGTASYLSVVTAQTLSLTNQRTAVQLRGRLMAASIALVAATGGGWSAQDTPVAAAPAQPQ